MKKVIALVAAVLMAVHGFSMPFNPWALVADLIPQQCGDSYEAANWGNRNDCGIDNALIMMNPNVMVRPRVGARSGGNNLEELTRIGMYGVPNYYYSHGTTNVWDLFRVSGNGGFTPSQMQDYVGKELLAPSWLTNQDDTFTASSWPDPTNNIWRSVIGDFPLPGLDFNLELRSLGGSNAAVSVGYDYFDSWDPTLTNIVQTQSDAGINHFHPGFHPDSPYQFIWQMILLKKMAFPTNVFTVVMDWNSTTPSQTNSCVASSVSKGSSSLTFTLNALHQGPAYDVPITNSLGVVTQTNDVRDAFSLYPAIKNYCQEIIRVTNCPSGTYLIKMHGTNWINCTDVELQNGINIWTNSSIANEFYMQSVAVLATQRIQRNINPTNATDAYVTNSIFANDAFQSNARATWPDFIGTPYQYGSAMQSSLLSNVAPYDSTEHTGAQQVPHAIDVIQVGTSKHMRIMIR